MICNAIGCNAIGCNACMIRIWFQKYFIFRSIRGCMFLSVMPINSELHYCTGPEASVPPPPPDFLADQLFSKLGRQMSPTIIPTTLLLAPTPRFSDLPPTLLYRCSFPAAQRSHWSWNYYVLVNPECDIRFWWKTGFLLDLNHFRSSIFITLPCPHQFTTTHRNSILFWGKPWIRNHG